jgi:hypothetical protein
MSPMGVMPCRVELEDEESGKLLEADADELEEGESRRPATQTTAKTPWPARQ